MPDLGMAGVFPEDTPDCKRDGTPIKGVTTWCDVCGAWAEGTMHYANRHRAQVYPEGEFVAVLFVCKACDEDAGT